MNAVFSQPLLLAATIEGTTHHTTVGDQTEQVQPAIAVYCSLKGLLYILDLVELSLLDGHVYADNLPALACCLMCANLAMCLIHLAKQLFPHQCSSDRLHCCP